MPRSQPLAQSGAAPSTGNEKVRKPNQEVEEDVEPENQLNVTRSRAKVGGQRGRQAPSRNRRRRASIDRGDGDDKKNGNTAVGGVLLPGPEPEPEPEAVISAAVAQPLAKVVSDAQVNQNTPWGDKAEDNNISSSIHVIDFFKIDRKA